MSKVKRVSADQIPVIDISSLVLGEADIEAAKSLHHASQNLGFLYPRTSTRQPAPRALPISMGKV